MKKLQRSYYDRDTVLVARDLLDKVLVYRQNGVERTGRIVETEAYPGGRDKASHSSRGLTPRNSVMFGPPGHAYVYLVYGMHHCFNVVTECEGRGSAVLIRALEPLKNLQGSASGPALLCRAMGIDRRLNGHDLMGDRLFIADPESSQAIRIARRPRIGVEYAGIWARRLLRFYIRGNRFVSRE